MFNKFAASFLALLVTAGCAYPQSGNLPDEAAPNTIPMYTVADCMPGDEFRNYIVKNFGHEPLLLGYGYVVFIQEDGTEALAEGVMFLTANLDSGSWGISITFEDDMTCSLTYGFDLQPMTYDLLGTDI